MPFRLSHAGGRLDLRIRARFGFGPGLLGIL